jgi:hypothetical protein
VDGGGWTVEGEGGRWRVGFRTVPNKYLLVCTDRRKVITIAHLVRLRLSGELKKHASGNHMYFFFYNIGTANSFGLRVVFYSYSERT